jgi:3-deoxy-D-arabino-heptulosonate 7-phosphate (DAHP) synthase
MRVAPDSPSTSELAKLNALSARAHKAIADKRYAICEAFDRPEVSLIAMPGYCSRPARDQIGLILREGQEIAQIEYRTEGLVTLHRGPTWKPRTNPEDWHGQETTDPLGAHQSVTQEAELLANVAMEIGYKEQLPRYASRLALIWSGGRSVGNTELIEQMAVFDRSLPLGIKNGLNGDIMQALQQVERAASLRSHGDAPVFLIYRGGENARRPDDWEDSYLEALDLTAGRLMVDTAHGSEMAHDPLGRWAKSVDGQILAIDHVLNLAEAGYHPLGITMEASSELGPTDPNMPLRIGLRAIASLMRIKAESTTLRSVA